MATLQIGGEAIAEWAPGNFVISIGNGTPNAVATFSVDGAATGQDVQLGPDGSLGYVTVVLFNAYQPGTHMLTITTPSDTGSRSFTIEKTVPTPTSSGVPATPSPQQSPGRWQFEDPVTDEIYVFPINPQTASAPYPARTLTDAATTTGRPIVTEGNVRSANWVLEGYIANQVQYDAFEHWSAKPYRIFITDDLGRQYVGVILDFAPVPFDPEHTADENYARSHFGMTIEVMKEVG